jgi:hypothetical protein
MLGDLLVAVPAGGSCLTSNVRLSIFLNTPLPECEYRPCAQHGFSELATHIIYDASDYPFISQRRIVLVDW